jgi:hypothetical protein
MDDPSFSESVENGILYSVVLPGSGNVVGGKAVLIRNFVQDIAQAYIKDIGVKAALGFNPQCFVKILLKQEKCKNFYKQKRK